MAIYDNDTNEQDIRQETIKEIAELLISKGYSYNESCILLWRARSYIGSLKITI